MLHQHPYLIHFKMSDKYSIVNFERNSLSVTNSLGIFGPFYYRILVGSLKVAAMK